MNLVRRNQPWIATLVAVVCVSLFLAFHPGSAQVGRADALHAVQGAVPITAQKQTPPPVGSLGAMVMDGDWLYIVKGNRLYKVQKSTMSVFQTIDLN